MLCYIDCHSEFLVLQQQGFYRVSVRVSGIVSRVDAVSCGGDTVAAKATFPAEPGVFVFLRRRNAASHIPLCFCGTSILVSGKLLSTVSY